ncbi:hypothetical protein MACH26_19000 [Planctobacterium marinum]|uniref:Uncharacterized protein n=1 Tax=Planctobacterium marinum TaxID=1631968 RepID=A0AA48KSD5_9ALTE|nr:hypothetical protein MACH26_19000 [Planctobacterium marinum]
METKHIFGTVITALFGKSFKPVHTLLHTLRAQRRFDAELLKDTYYGKNNFGVGFVPLYTFLRFKHFGGTSG